MKIKMILILLLAIFFRVSNACPVCEKQQPKITKGLTHGAGPQSNWDWVIIAIITAIMVFTLIWSLKYLIKPGKKNSNHIKQLILNN